MGNSQTSLGFGDFVVDKTKSEVHEDWMLSPGKLNDNGVSVFSAILPDSSRKRPYMEKALQCSKIYRHPGILKYVEGGIFGDEVVVVTEQATPLIQYGLDTLSPLEVTVGLSSIIEALVFLHDKAGVSHNNICPATIFVTSDGIWKLWGFEYLCSFGELTRDHIERINQYCYENGIPPDDKSRISPAYQHARDCYALGKFIEDHVSPIMTNEVPGYSNLLNLLKEKALSSDWTLRPRLSVIQEESFFSHDFLKLHSNISNILLLPSEKKEEFIRSLPTSLAKYPEELVATTLSPLLFSRPVLLIPSSATYLTPFLLTTKESSSNGIFSSSVFKEHVIPHIIKLFSIHDAVIRKILLKNFNQYINLISDEILKEILLPELLLGIKDTDEDLISATLHSLAYVVPVLGANIVIGHNRQHIFTTSKPKATSNAKELKKRKREKLSLPVQSAPQGINWLKNEKISSTTDITPPPALLQVSTPARDTFLERSSPDGGEIDEVFSRVSEGTKKEGKESWSEEWEDMMDKPTPEIDFGRLEVMMTPDIENAAERDFKITVQRERNVSGSSERRKSTSSLDKQFNGKGSIMKLKTKPKGKQVVPLNLGEEYSIKSIKIEKKQDSELDFFADIAPNLNTKAYDLETMLMEASNVITKREKIPSISDTLAELDLSGTAAGEDGWQDEIISFDPDEDAVPDIDQINKNGSKLSSQNEWGDNWDVTF